MTSIPASRRARAMIFAPRSCPSRPGLATTTRIFFVLLGAGSLMVARGRADHMRPRASAPGGGSAGAAWSGDGLARRRQALALLVLAERAEVPDDLAVADLVGTGRAHARGVAPGAAVDRALAV